MNWRHGTQRIARGFISKSKWIVLVLAMIGSFVILGLITFPTQGGTLITVDTTDDELTIDGDCSLREAMFAANNNVAKDLCPAGAGMDTIL